MRARKSYLNIAISAGLIAAACFGISACGSSDNKKNQIEALDEKLAGKGSDPAMNAALEDRILVDPDLVDGANNNMVQAADAPLNGASPADTGYDGDKPGGNAIRSSRTYATPQELNDGTLLRAPKPRIVAAENCTDCGANRGMTLDEAAAAQGVKRGKGTCSDKLQYGASWAGRMPTEFPLYPQSRLKEAAGVEGGLCDIRVASFTTSANMQSVADYYYTRAKRSGFSADYEIRGGEHMLGGVRDNDGGAYVITLNPARGGGTAVDIVANNGR